MTVRGGWREHLPASPVRGAWVVEVDSAGDGEGRGYTGRLGADRAVILRPDG